jgi:predicted dehydrogenase
LSTARIGTEKVIPAMQRGECCDVTAIASRDPARAEQEAKKLDIAKAYGSYEDLLADPEIDAIYNPLPNHMHVPWSIKALQAGKHVLCEKPIGLSVAEAEQLVAAGEETPHLKLMEAFMYRHHPQWQRARQIVTEGGIGRLRTIQTFFSYFNDSPQDIRNQTEMGGGGLMDIGCYPISLSRFIFAGEPQRVFGIAESDPRFSTDRLTSAILEFADGTSSFTCSTQLTPYQRVNIFGERGRVEIEIPFNAPPDRPCRLWHQQQSEIREIVLEVCDQYTIQGDLFSQAVLNDSEVPTPLRDAVDNMRVIEAIFRSAKSGRWEMPS